MVKIKYSDAQKLKIEDIYWNWFKNYHLKDFKEIIDKDKVFKEKVLFEDYLSDEKIKQFLLSLPSELEKLAVNIDSISKTIKTDTKDFLLKNYGNFRQSQAPKIIKELNIRSCPYCNQNYIFSYQDIQKTKKISLIGELDHFYSKNIYPELSLCLYNLVPCCSRCNKEKSDNKIIINPYNREASFKSFFQTEFDLDIIDLNYLLGLSENFLIKLNTENASNEEEKQLTKIFKIPSKYQEMKREVKNTILKMNMYNDLYINKIEDNFGLNEELTISLFGVEDNDVEMVLSKLIKDVLNEFI